MTSTTDKIKGLANKAAGTLKQTVGRATGNRKLEAEGAAQEIKGRSQKTVGSAKAGVKKAASKAKSSR